MQPMQLPPLYIYEVEARPMLAARRTGVWLTYRVVAPSPEEATPSSIINHASNYFGCGVTLTVDSNPRILDALVFTAQVGGGQETPES